MIERNESSYQLSQDGRMFLLKTSIIAEKLKLQCYDYYDQTRPFIGIFSLQTLKSSNPIFNKIQYIDQSRQYLNTLIERKSVRIFLTQNDLLYIVFYFTDKNKITLGLSRENKNYQYNNQRTNTSKNQYYPMDQQYISQSAIPLSQQNIPNDNYSASYIMQSPNDINKLSQQQISLSAINNYPQDYQKPINNINVPNNSNYQEINNMQNYKQINNYPSNENNFQQQQNFVEVQNYDDNQMRQLENENLNLREELEKIRVEFEKYANEISVIEKENQNLKQENENIKGENNILNTELEKLKNEYIDLDNSISKLQEDFQNLKIENDNLKNENENLRNENDDLKNINDDLNQKLNNFDNGNELENLKNDYYKLNNQNTEYTNQIAILQNENNTIKTENQNLKSENNNILSENQNLKNNNESLIQQINQIQKNNINQNDLTQLQKENSELKKKLTESNLLKKQITELQQQIEILTQKNNNTTASDDEKSNDVKGEIIHNMDELELITKKINKDNKKIIINLLYKASADGDKAAIFHNKCDGAKNSIVLVETKKGKRFGGFTTCSWSGKCVDKNDSNAFIFSFDKMKTYDNIPGDEAIGCYPKFGPIFLGCQIKIFDEFFKKGGTTFEKDLNFATTEDYELTGGERVFDVKDVEVYEVIIS